MQFEHTGFFDLIADALFHYREASACRDAKDLHASYRANRHARTSILASIFSVECAANCLIEALDVSKPLKQEIDKLNVLAKFDLYAVRTDSAQVDRSDARCGRIVELVQARNAFVHPRRKRTKLEVEGLAETEADHMIGVSIEGELYPALGIPIWPVFWIDSSAEKALTASCDFLSWYFTDLLKWEPARVFGLLASRMVVGDHEVGAVFEEIYDEIRTVGRKFNFAYLHVPEALEPARRETLYRRVPKFDE
ncbi:hypothetical protein C9I57_28135 [Trinickia symbiotica]|uniref:Uncharacterized protein n=1 Tax=Trinickia symbiotica TaxID=863227 RepID=A0A2T3XLJ2_9BURK|nr:hypothetical protein [Trinickia symbiotica]PTB17386.1 hypothetical protein C9I57_28135 [Trinickia symbiotica]